MQGHVLLTLGMLSAWKVGRPLLSGAGAVSLSLGYDAYFLLILKKEAAYFLFIFNVSLFARKVHVFKNAFGLYGVLTLYFTWPNRSNMTH